MTEIQIAHGFLPLLHTTETSQTSIDYGPLRPPSCPSLTIVYLQLKPKPNSSTPRSESSTSQRHQKGDTKRINGVRTRATERNNKIIIALGKQREWKEILHLYEKEGVDFNDVNLATTMSQLAKIRSMDTTNPIFGALMDDLAIRFQSNVVTSFRTRNNANIAHSIGKLKLSTKRATEIMKLLASPELATWLVSNGNTQDVANTAWAFATLDVIAPALFKVIENRADWLVSEGNTQEIANTAWAFATLKFEAPAFFKAIENRADWLVSEGSTQEVANTAWAFAKLDVKSPALFKSIEKSADWLVSEGNTQQVTNTAWAFATLDVKSPALFKAIENRADWLVSKGNTQDVANTAWAFATLDVKAPAFFKVIENRADWLVSEGNTQHIATTARAFAALDFNAPALFKAIEKRADWLVSEGSTQNVANTAWALATLDVKAPSFFKAIEKRVDWLVSDGNTQQVANTAWAFAALKFEAPAFFQAIENRADWLVSEGNRQEVANTAWAFATLGIKAPSFFKAMDKNADWLVSEGSTQNVVNTAWAFATSGQISRKVFQRTENLMYSNSQLSQKFISQLCFVIAFANLNGLNLHMPDVSAFVPSNVKVSKIQQEISDILKDIGFPHELEVPADALRSKKYFPPGLLSIDIANIEWKIAIECDGPHHYLNRLQDEQPTDIEDGPTKAKRILLQQMGWNVVNIPNTLWKRAQNLSERKTLLRSLLPVTGDTFEHDFHGENN